MKKVDEISQILVSRALDDTKKMRKAGADIFAKSGPEKPLTHQTKIKLFSGLFTFFAKFPVDLVQIRLNPRTNGWAPNVAFDAKACVTT